MFHLLFHCWALFREKSKEKLEVERWSNDILNARFWQMILILPFVSLAGFGEWVRTEKRKEQQQSKKQSLRQLTTSEAHLCLFSHLFNENSFCFASKVFFCFFFLSRIHCRSSQGNYDFDAMENIMQSFSFKWKKQKKKKKEILIGLHSATNFKILLGNGSVVAGLRKVQEREYYCWCLVDWMRKATTRYWNNYDARPQNIYFFLSFRISLFSFFVSSHLLLFKNANGDRVNAISLFIVSTQNGPEIKEIFMNKSLIITLKMKWKEFSLLLHFHCVSTSSSDKRHTK